MILGRWLASEPDAFGQNLNRPSKLDLGWFCVQYDPGFFLEEGNWNRMQEDGSSIWFDSGCMLDIIAITGPSQNASESDLACLLGLRQPMGFSWGMLTTKHMQMALHFSAYCFVLFLVCREKKAMERHSLVWCKFFFVIFSLFPRQKSLFCLLIWGLSGCYQCKTV